jgi:hypothetical protein
MKEWLILKKTVKYIDADSNELHMTVERGGVQRDVIVSGHSFDSHKEGDGIMLPTHSGTSEGHAAALSVALHRVLVKAGALPKDLQLSGQDLLAAADKYAGS